MSSIIFACLRFSLFPKVGNSAFAECDYLTSVILPESVENIEMQAFRSCSGLNSITIKNPDCYIFDSDRTISSYKWSDGFRGTIYGYENSTAQAYAEKYGYNFEILADEILAGDADLDGEVGILDVVKVMMYVANKEANPLSKQGLINADVYNSGDGVFIADALSIQKKVAQIIDTLPES